MFATDLGPTPSTRCSRWRGISRSRPAPSFRLTTLAL